MLKRLYKPLTLTILFCIIFLVSCMAQNSPTELTLLTQGTITNNITKTVGEEATKIQEEDGTTCYIYENSKYADYIGTTTYYCAEDQVMMSRWAYDVAEDENRGDVYNDILDTLQEEYGTFTKGDNDVTYTLQTEKETISLTSFSVEGGYNIVITYN